MTVTITIKFSVLWAIITKIISAVQPNDIMSACSTQLILAPNPT